MKIIVNGEEYITTASNLEQLCLDLSYDILSVATAKNGLFIARGNRQDTILENGDQIEILAPLQGG